MEKLYRALGMVDKDGNVFDLTKVREQVMSALGVSKPVIETVPAPKPPFRQYAECVEACLALPEPEDEDFAQAPAAAQTLAVAVMLDLEMEGNGARQYLESCGTAYTSRTADSLRELGLPEHAAAFERWLDAAVRDEEAANPFRKDGNQETGMSGDAAEKGPVPFCEPLEEYDWSLLPKAILSYANAHPEAFCAAD